MPHSEQPGDSTPAMDAIVNETRQSIVYARNAYHSAQTSLAPALVAQYKARMAAEAGWLARERARQNLHRSDRSITAINANANDKAISSGNPFPSTIPGCIAPHLSSKEADSTLRKIIRRAGNIAKFDGSVDHIGALGPCAVDGNYRYQTRTHEALPSDALPSSMRHDAKAAVMAECVPHPSTLLPPRLRATSPHSTLSGGVMAVTPAASTASPLRTRIDSSRSRFAEGTTQTGALGLATLQGAHSSYAPPGLRPSHPYSILHDSTVSEDGCILNDAIPAPAPMTIVAPVDAGIGVGGAVFGPDHLPAREGSGRQRMIPLDTVESTLLNRRTYASAPLTDAENGVLQFKRAAEAPARERALRMSVNGNTNTLNHIANGSLPLKVAKSMPILFYSRRPATADYIKTSYSPDSSAADAYTCRSPMTATAGVLLLREGTIPLPPPTSGAPMSATALPLPKVPRQAPHAPTAHIVERRKDMEALSHHLEGGPPLNAATLHQANGSAASLTQKGRHFRGLGYGSLSGYRVPLVSLGLELDVSHFHNREKEIEVPYGTTSVDINLRRCAAIFDRLEEIQDAAQLVMSYGSASGAKETRACNAPNHQSQLLFQPYMQYLLRNGLSSLGYNNEKNVQGITLDELRSIVSDMPAARQPLSDSADITKPLPFYEEAEAAVMAEWKRHLQHFYLMKSRLNGGHPKPLLPEEEKKLFRSFIENRGRTIWAVIAAAAAAEAKQAEEDSTNQDKALRLSQLATRIGASFADGMKENPPEINSKKVDYPNSNAVDLAIAAAGINTNVYVDDLLKLDRFHPHNLPYSDRRKGSGSSGSQRRRDLILLRQLRQDEARTQNKILEAQEEPIVDNHPCQTGEESESQSEMDREKYYLIKKPYSGVSFNSEKRRAHMMHLLRLQQENAQKRDSVFTKFGGESGKESETVAKEDQDSLANLPTEQAEELLKELERVTIRPADIVVTHRRSLADAKARRIQQRSADTMAALSRSSAQKNLLTAQHAVTKREHSSLVLRMRYNVSSRGVSHALVQATRYQPRSRHVSGGELRPDSRVRRTLLQEPPLLGLIAKTE